MDVNGSKRTGAVVVAGAKALLTNPKVQEAVVEKGIEVAGKLVDKQLQIIEDAQQKAADFLKKEASFPICLKLKYTVFKFSVRRRRIWPVRITYKQFDRKLKPDLAVALLSAVWCYFVV